MLVTQDLLKLRNAAASPGGIPDGDPIGLLLGMKRIGFGYPAGFDDLPVVLLQFLLSYIPSVVLPVIHTVRWDPGAVILMQSLLPAEFIQFLPEFHPCGR